MFRNMYFRKMEQAGKEAGQGGSTPTAEELAALAAQEAAKVAADKAAADKEAADKAAAEKAAKSDDDDDDDDDVQDPKLKKAIAESIKRKNKLREVTEANAALAAQLKKYENVDLEEVQRMLTAKKDAERKELENKGQFDKILEQIQADHAQTVSATQAELTARDQKLAAMAAQIETLTIGSKFDASTFIRDEMTLSPRKARQLYGAHFDTNEDGTVVGYDLPRGSATRAPLVDGTGSPLAFDKAFRKIIEADADKETLLKAKQKPGASSGTGTPAKSEAPADESKGMNRILSAIQKGVLDQVSTFDLK